MSANTPHRETFRHQANDIFQPEVDQGPGHHGTITRQYLIDTSQELRLQMVRAGIDRIDGVIYTHAHADHIFGLDDLRRFNAVMKKPVDMFAEPATLNKLRQTFEYVFAPERNENNSFVATLVAHELRIGEPFVLYNARWTPIRLMHGKLPIVGLRIDWNASANGDKRSLAYCTDVSLIPPESYPLLEGLDVLVIDALRYRPHPTHMTVEQALCEIAIIKPKRSYFTHIAHDIRHEDLSARLPENVFLSYDGLKVIV
ncbi:MAG: MBL fold metallo-hydrolase [Phycisphaerales bacterium]|nr:MBL fold metallo-hydrolase [Phycisphaerales bacterium]